MSPLVAMNTLLALVSLCASVGVINSMGRHTNLMCRVAFILLGTGSAGMLISPILRDVTPTLDQIFLLLGLTILAIHEVGVFRRRDPQQ